MSEIKRKMWETIMNPHLYKVYTKVINKALHVLPSPEFDGHEVIPHLYVGDVWAAYNLEELKKRNITHVVTVVMGLEPTFPSEFKYLNVQVRDVESENIFDHFEEVVKFIDEGRANGNVFLHCLRGVSRSGTIAAAYIIHQNKVPAGEAIAILRAHRQVIDPNPSFIRQLDNYYQSITTTTTTTTTTSIPPSSHESSDNNNNNNNIEVQRETNTETNTTSVLESPPAPVGTNTEVKEVIEEDGTKKVIKTETTTVQEIKPTTETEKDKDKEIETDKEKEREGEQMESFKTITHEGLDGEPTTTLVVDK